MPDHPLPTAPAPAPDPILAEAPHHIGTVTLVVHDSGRVARFYQDVFGLERLGHDQATTTLGVQGKPLLELRHDPAARMWSPREAGLFHTAFLLPTRADLGAWLGHMTQHRFPISGASDHLVSEAAYLTDPEGNGIEVYADRPSATWTRTQAGVAMATERLDIASVIASASAPWSGMPAGGRIGHVHLQAGDLPQASVFYADLLGFDIMARYTGALFYGSGGYHHQLATNIWNSRGAPPRTDRTTGLAEVELLFKTPDTLHATRTRLAAATYPVVEADGGLRVRDPWNTTLRLALVPFMGAGGGLGRA